MPFKINQPLSVSQQLWSVAVTIPD